MIDYFKVNPTNWLIYGLSVSTVEANFLGCFMLKDIWLASNENTYPFIITSYYWSIYMKLVSAFYSPNKNMFLSQISRNSKVHKHYCHSKLMKFCNEY